MFKFVCHDSAFLMYGTLRNPTIKRWTILSTKTSILAVIIFTLFGIFGYLLFGHKLDSNILNNFPATNIFAIIARVIYCFNAALTYPVAFFVLRHVCYNCYHYKNNRKFKYCDSWFEQLILTVLIFILSVIIGSELDNLGFIMSLTGSVPSVILVFIMPSLCYLKASQGTNIYQVNKKRFCAIILLLFGILIGVFSTALTIVGQLDLNIFTS